MHLSATADIRARWTRWKGTDSAAATTLIHSR